MRTTPPFAVSALTLAVLGATPLVAQTWTMATTTAAPSPRRAGAMVFDVTGNRMLINGGTIASPAQVIGETWTYNGATWTQLNPANPGLPRWGHRLVRDTANNRLITFGGRSPGISGLANDTWAWTGTTWAQLTPVTRPSPRFGYGMVFDGYRNVVVLFGGRAALANSNQTWQYDGLNWSLVATAHSPSPREDLVMAFDAGTGSTILFGGYDNDTATLLGDTWEYRGLDWVEATPATSPSPRYRCAAAFDNQRQRVVVYGGHDGTAFRTDTFTYTGSTWEQVSVTAGSPHSTEMYAGYDSQRNRFVTFGGVGSVFSSQTWEYSGAATASFGSFGQGCPHSLGLSTITGTAPALGQNFTMTVQNVPASTAAVVVAQGFNNTAWAGGPLPFDLTPFGLAGCYLEVADNATSAVLPVANQFTFGFTVPNNTALLNRNYYVQAFIPDSGAANTLGGMSRPSRGIFGN